VVGVDLLEKMIEQSRARAKAEGVQDRVEFRVADARRLPFEDNLFDAVIMESLNVFFEDKRQGMSEYIRVAKPRGYVGMTEMTWLKPPLPEHEELFMRTAHAEALEADGWTALLEGSGLQEVVGSAYPIDIPLESRGRFERYGTWKIVRVMPRMVFTFLKNRKGRAYLKEVTGGLSRDLLTVRGYGVYAGRKGTKAYETCR
jgi:ubiquinone/menaquinone biosynthesis C-methylase UbiE